MIICQEAGGDSSDDDDGNNNEDEDDAYYDVAEKEFCSGRQNHRCGWCREHQRECCYGQDAGTLPNFHHYLAKLLAQIRKVLPRSRT